MGKVVCNFGVVCPNCYTAVKQIKKLKVMKEIKLAGLNNVNTCKCLGFPFNLARSWKMLVILPTILFKKKVRF